MWHKWYCQGQYLTKSVWAAFSSFTQIIQLSPSRRPSSVLFLDSSPQTRGSGVEFASRSPGPAAEFDGPTPYSITSVSWAPSCGRSYHLIATGSRDGHVRIWRVKPPLPPDEIEQDEDEARDSGWSATIVGDFDDHKWVFDISAIKSI
jgi:nucleoporin SEH1